MEPVPRLLRMELVRSRRRVRSSWIRVRAASVGRLAEGVALLQYRGEVPAK